MRDRNTSVNEESRGVVDEDGTNVLFDAWLTFRAVQGVLDQAVAASGLTSDEFGVYSVLTGTDEMTPSELAKWMSAPPTTVSSYIKRLEGRGHLERRKNPADGRSSVLVLTDAGRAAHRAAGAAFLPVLIDVRDRLGRREPTVRSSLAAIRDALDTAG